MNSKLFRVALIGVWGVVCGATDLFSMSDFVGKGAMACQKAYSFQRKGLSLKEQKALNTLVGKIADDPKNLTTDDLEPVCEACWTWLNKACLLDVYRFSDVRGLFLLAYLAVQGADLNTSDSRPFYILCMGNPKLAAGLVKKGCARVDVVSLNGATPLKVVSYAKKRYGQQVEGYDELIAAIHERLMAKPVV
jgi:hypothetical protein